MDYEEVFAFNNALFFKPILNVTINVKNDFYCYCILTPLHKINCLMTLYRVINRTIKAINLLRNYVSSTEGVAIGQSIATLT